MLLKFNLLFLPTRIERERTMEEVESLKEDLSPRRTSAPRKVPKKRSPRGNVSTVG